MITNELLFDCPKCNANNMVMLADEIPEGGNIKSCSDCGYVITKADIIDILNERQEYLNKNKEKHKSAEKKKGL